MSTAAAQPPAPARKATLDEATVLKLEKALSHRPEKAELVDRNILKDDEGVAPGLVAAKEKLKRSQLEDKLEHALQQRPKAEDLVKEGILNADEVPEGK